MNLARRVVNVLMLTNADDELRDAALDEFYPLLLCSHEIGQTKFFVMKDLSLVLERDGAVLCADGILQAWEILSEPDDQDARLMSDDLVKHSIEQQLERKQHEEEKKSG